jgi:transposase
MCRNHVPVFVTLRWELYDGLSYIIAECRNIDPWYTHRMKAFSIDLRIRVLAALDGGMSRSEAVRLFQVSLGSIKRWLRARAADDLAPKRPTGRPRRITPTQEQQLRVQVQITPDATLDEHAAQWAADTGRRISRQTLGRALHRLGLSRKKSRPLPASATPGNVRRLHSGKATGTPTT